MQLLELSQLGLPDPTQKLSSDFIRNFGRLALLTTPSKLQLAAADFSGNKNFGTLNGGVTVQASGWGVFGQAWRFPGSSGSYATVTLPGFTSLNDMSVHVVFSADAFAQPRFTRLIEQGGNNSWTLDFSQVTAGSGQLTAMVNGTSQVTTSASLLDGKTHLASFTLAGGTVVALYIDGVLIGTATSASSPSSPTASINIGRYGGGGYNLTGSIYFVSIFQRVHSAGQVSSLYNALRTGKPFPLFEPDYLLIDEPSTGTTINLTAKSFVFSSSNSQENISRPLNSKEISPSDSQANITFTRNLRSDIESQSFSSSATSILRPINSQATSQSESNSQKSLKQSLNSQILVQSSSLAETSIKKELNSTSLSQSLGDGNYTTQISTKFSVLSYRRYSSQYFVQSGSINDDGQ